MNLTNSTPLHRKHSNILCNCRHCKQFDYADTAILPPLEQPSRFVVVELIRAINTETGKRHDYCIVPSQKSRPYNKYQR